MSDPERQRQKRRQADRRRRLKRRLEAEGVDPDEINRQVEELRLRHLEQRIDSTWERHLNPDDSRYRPTAVDPLERGAGRVTERTAKAARKRKATTRYELEEGRTT